MTLLLASQGFRLNLGIKATIFDGNVSVKYGVDSRL